MMTLAITLRSGKSYIHECPVCNKRVSIGGGQGVGGYRYSAHHEADAKAAWPTSNCPGSSNLVKDEVLKKLAEQT
jgi:hypothetical protein